MIENTKFHEILDIPKLNGEYIYGKNDVFALLIILKQLLRKEDFRAMIKEIEYELNLLSSKLSSISIGLWVKWDFLVII